MFASLWSPLCKRANSDFCVVCKGKTKGEGVLRDGEEGEGGEGRGWEGCSIDNRVEGTGW